jgi:hypothetical protein
MRRIKMSIKAKTNMGIPEETRQVYLTWSQIAVFQRVENAR